MTSETWPDHGAPDDGASDPWAAAGGDPLAEYDAVAGAADAGGPPGDPGVDPPGPSGSGSPPTASAYLERLNEAQRAAVEALDGPVLVLAGAGTGKTRVLTTRLAHLLNRRKAFPSQILAVTFTNKAAREMRERVARLMGGPVEGMWMGTFHALAARMLRRHAEEVGLKPNFTILDPDDQQRLMKQLMQAENIDQKRWPARMILSVIDRWKDKGLTPDKLKADDGGDIAGGRVVKLYADYQARLRTLNACDFGDLLLHTLTLFAKQEEVTDPGTGEVRMAFPVLEQWQRRFRYILVDEYQDTNTAQYLWLRALAQRHRNICCVGDDDQCLPVGTLVRMADGSERPIEMVSPGDAVMSAQGGGAFGASQVARVYRKDYRGSLVAVTLETGERLLSTPTHRHFAGYRLGTSPQLCFTYLMYKRGYGYRLGTSQTYTRGQVAPVLGFELRCRQEHADALWVLSTHRTEAEARYQETCLSLEYGIPTLPFVARTSALALTQPGKSLIADQGLLDRLFRERRTEEAGQRVLDAFDLSADFPHYRPQSHTGRRRNVTVTVCGERRTAAALHRISIITSDSEDADTLRSLGLSVRPTKKGHPGWRYETALADLGAVMRIVDQVRAAFDGDVALVQYGRFGHGRTDHTAARKVPVDALQAADSASCGFAAPAPAVAPAQEAKSRSSLPMVPAGSIRQGMTMFRADGSLGVVQDVARLDGTTEVIDLDIARTHNFIANGIVTHNSIYGWRGAEVGNILRFEQDFPGATVVRLEQNYRSTPHILGAASGLIAYNRGRLGKTLFTDLGEGEPVRVHSVWDGEEEARWIAGEVENAQTTGHSLDEIAVLVRAGFQMREFEERFLAIGLPYRVVGGPRFYERMEIRDAMAYLRVIAQPADDLAFERIVNTPKRGLAKATLQTLHSIARDYDLALTSAAWRAVETEGTLKPKPRSSLRALMQDFERWRGLVERTPHAELAQMVLDESGYTAMWQAEKSPEAQGRLDNLKEMVTAMEEFGSLAEFLEHVALVMENAEDASQPKVTLMTLHSAKGLEFDTVFLPGWEEGVFPNQRALDESGLAGLEEERRLAYVGLTRARQRAIVTCAANRRIHGQWQSTLPSRFLEELPEPHVQTSSDPGLSAGAGGAGSFGGGFGGGPAGGPAGVREAMAAPMRPPPREMLKQTGMLARSRPLVIDGSGYEVTERARPEKAFVAGDRVFHQKFGYGTVRSVDTDKLTIAFDHSGDKKVMDSFVVPADQV